MLGTGAAGLTQYLAIVVAAMVGYLAAARSRRRWGKRRGSYHAPRTRLSMIVSFGAFFLLGFVLYSTLYAAAGSMVSRIEDVQQAAGPLIFLAIGGYFAAFTGLNDPDARWVAVLSIVPFFSPYLMPARILLTSVGVGECCSRSGSWRWRSGRDLDRVPDLQRGRPALRPARGIAECLASDSRLALRSSRGAIHGRRLELVVGDITTERVDAIGNAANERLRGGGGVDGATRLPRVRCCSRSCVGAIQMARPPARPWRPKGHALPARWVIHAVGPIWRGGGRGEEALLDGAYRSCLRLADELGARSVGFPAISMGIYGYPADEGARVAVRAVAEHLRRRDRDRARALRPLQRRDVRPLRRRPGNAGGFLSPVDRTRFTRWPLRAASDRSTEHWTA